MALYMDIHIIPGIKAKDVAEAHQKDILLQEEHQCKCMTYWIDEERNNVFCLIEAPDKESVAALHQHSHGLVPHKVIEVNPELVESFLGRLHDPVNAPATENGLKIFNDPSYRIILFITTTDPALLRHQLGAEKANELLNGCTNVIRQNLAVFDGREVEHPGTGFIASFTAASKAVSCALSIQEAAAQPAMQTAGVKIGINAGEPVSTGSSLFGDTIQFARHLCFISCATRIAISSAVKELAAKDHFQKPANNIICLAPPDEILLELLFSKLEEHWQNPDFTISEFCQAMAMSQSQLYRKTVELTGMSPNIFLKEYRLEKAKELLNQQRYSISQITFDAGFTSPSYFTKCFKKNYGLLPMDYLELLH
ncbi:MAG: nickel-binding protein [Niastella sp.]|uniref:nickel-binding protein n=1 Tax=Niastella sp. TaxID=1869183 RepID=UPI00389A9986